MAQQFTVFVVDADPQSRHLVRGLLQSVGVPVEAFESAEAFLSAIAPEREGVLITDLRMAGMSGLELIKHLNTERWPMPAIVVSAHGEVAAAVRALKAGAHEFLCKPFNQQELLDAVNGALRAGQARHTEHTRRSEIMNRFAALTPRELDLFKFVVSGQANKVAAANLGLSEMTIEIHRSHVMKKMKAQSLAHLVRMAVDIERVQVRPSRMLAMAA